MLYEIRNMCIPESRAGMSSTRKEAIAPNGRRPSGVACLSTAARQRSNRSLYICFPTNEATLAESVARTSIIASKKLSGGNVSANDVIYPNVRYIVHDGDIYVEWSRFETF